MDTQGLFKPPDSSHLPTSACRTGPRRGQLILSTLQGDDSLHGHRPTYGGPCSCPGTFSDTSCCAETQHSRCSLTPPAAAGAPCPLMGDTELVPPPSPAAYSPTCLRLCHRQERAVRGVTARGLISVQKVSTKKANMLKAHILPVLSTSFADAKHGGTAPAASALSLRVC